MKADRILLITVLLVRLCFLPGVSRAETDVGQADHY